MLFDDLACSESEFQRVGTETENTRVPVWVLTLGTDNKWKSDEQSSLGLGAKESMENRYEWSEEISEVEQNGKLETMWQPLLSSSEHTEVLEYP
jgi:hypothetical protein